MRIKQSLYFLSIICLFLAPSVRAYQNAHFYRAALFSGEPRFQKNWLTSLDFFIGSGKTTTGRDFQGDTTGLLNIYGTHNMRIVGKGVPNKDLTNPIDINLTQLALLPPRDCFGNLSFSSRFKLRDGVLSVTQNIKHGLFLQGYIPFRTIELDCIEFCDLSPTNSVTPNVNEFEWQTFLNQFDAMLARYNINIDGFTKSGIGDICVFLGWAQNYDETEVLDYVDTTFKIGVLIPTADERDPDKAFDIPLGHDNHFGVPIVLDIAVGAYEWVTLGFHVDALLFLSKTRTIRMKTDLLQCGMIKLAKGCAKFDQGSLWNVGVYFKADHVVGGLSLVAGYTFSNKNSDTLCPENTCVFDPGIVNTDEMFKGWKMHTINFLGEYDFTRKDSRLGFRVGVFYNRQISGKRIFKTHMGGGSVGIDLTWVFD